MVDFCIKTHSGITIVTGYKINKDYSCHKDEKKDHWVITDTKSGLKIADGFKTGKECFNYIKNTDLSEIEKRKQTDRYNRVCAELDAWRKENLL